MYDSIEDLNYAISNLNLKSENIKESLRKK